VVELARLESE